MKPITDPRPSGHRILAIARRLAPFVVLVAVAAAGWYGYRRWRGGPSAISYTTTAVARSTVLQTVTSSGTLSPVVRSTVGSQVSGRITEILVDFNDHVSRGQVLARLDKQLLAGQVSQAEARLTSARAELSRAQATAANARLNHDRMVKQLAAGVVAASEVDDAKASRLVAEAAIASARSSIVEAQAAVTNARTNLAYTTITAPIDGVIISRSVDAGQTVAASLQAPELFVIAGDLKKMELHASVAEADVGQLADGMRVELAFDAFPDRTFAGEVKQVRNQATTTQNVVTYDAVVAVDNPDGVLRPGMTATATFVVAEAKDVLVVPAKALRYRPASAARTTSGAAAGSGRGGLGRTGQGGSAAGGAPRPRTGAESGRRGPSPAVWVLRAGVPVRVAVETGLSDGNDTAIVGGELAEGDQVITADSSAKTATGAAGAAGAAGGSSRRSGSGGRPAGPPSLF